VPLSQSTHFELPVVLDRRAPVPLHAQLTRALRAAIVDGRLAPGRALPSTRRLAADLGLARAVVVEAYAQLVAEGRLEAHGGSGTRVADVGPVPSARRAPPRQRPRAEAPARFDLRPGRPDPALFPRAAWSAALGEAVRDATAEQLGYPDPAGPPALRTAVAAYLGRVRGVLADPDDVVIVAGVAQGAGLVAAALSDRGAWRVAVEDPSSAGTREVIAAAGLEVVPVPVDGEGLVVDALAATDADAVLVTPAHQFPTGVVLSPGRRAALADWAARSGGTVIEDDYDAEFRFDRSPVAAVQGLAPEAVAYVGSVSKTLSPALRLGWLVPPRGLLDAVVERKRLADLGCPTLEGLAFARLLERGTYDRALRRARQAYRRRRDAVLDGLGPAVPVSGAAAGLHLVLGLDADADEVAVAAAARAAGVDVATLAEHRLAAQEPRGLLLGFAALPEAALRFAGATLAGVLAEAPRRDQPTGSPSSTSTPSGLRTSATSWPPAGAAEEEGARGPTPSRRPARAPARRSPPPACGTSAPCR